MSWPTTEDCERGSARPGFVRSHTGVVAAAGWLLVYLSLWGTGERFSAGYLKYGWQLIPWETLSTDPLRSVWYLHVQPPLWNLTLGGLGWFSPLSDAITVQMLMAAVGLAGTAAAACLARRLGLRPGAALAVTWVATLNPETMRGAFEPQYEFVISALLVVLALIIVRVGEDQRALIWLSVIGTTIVMTRSLYHPIWLVSVLGVVAAAVAWRGPGVNRRTLIVMVLIPLLTIGGWMLKNEILFGRPTLSSWVGMNLQRSVIPVLPADEFDRMYADGQVSDVARIGPFSAYALYAPFPPASECTVHHSHPALTEPGRATDAVTPNFNYECYLPVFDQAQKDALAVSRAHPDAWIEGRLWSGRVFFAVFPGPKKSESPIMRGLDRVYSVARVDVPGAISTTSWGNPIFGRISIPGHFTLLTVALYAATLALGAIAAVAILRRRDELQLGPRLVCVITAMTVAWTYVVGIIGELGEQARFRTMTDVIVWVVVPAVLLAKWVPVLRDEESDAGPLAGPDHGHAIDDLADETTGLDQ